MNIYNIQKNQIHHYHAANYSSPENTEIGAHIGSCLQMIPPRQLGRLLRDGFMIYLEELQITVPAFKDFITELTVLLIRLDAEEDKLEKEKHPV